MYFQLYLQWYLEFLFSMISIIMALFVILKLSNEVLLFLQDSWLCQVLIFDFFILKFIVLLIINK